MNPWQRFRRLPLRQRVVWCVLFGWVGALSLGCALMFNMPGKSFRGVLPSLTDSEIKIEAHLQRHVTKLAGEIGVRNLLEAPTQLQQAADYIQAEFAALGYEVTTQSYPAPEKLARNLEAIIPGQDLAAPCVVVGTHYDSAEGCPAANDNASGIAGVLELARLLHGRPFERTIRLVAFANEEPPYFQTELMGSLVYAKSLRAQQVAVSAMLSLETIGYYSDEPNSQQFPVPGLKLFYPTTGNYIAFIGNTGSRGLVRRSVKSFRQHAQFPSEGVATFASVPGIGWSDHWAFWQAGYPGLMVTDTAPYRYPHYHTPQDTPDKLDYPRTARVVQGLAGVVADLAGPMEQTA